MEDLPLSPGFRFFPTEEELVAFYLHNQLEGKRTAINRVIPEIDINGLEPWNLPTLAGELCREDKEQWFFFSPSQERETRGGRPNRTTACGYWKATGSPGYVYSSDNRVIGVKKTMVFYKGKAPTGKKTKWKMNEYRAIQVTHSNQSSSPTPQLRREFSLCRVYVISGSLRAFDRRPLEKPIIKSQLYEIENRGVAAASARQGAGFVDGSNSSVTFQLGEHHSAIFADVGDGGEGTSGTNWNLEMEVEVEEPLWQLQQDGWL